MNLRCLLLGHEWIAAGGIECKWGDFYSVKLRCTRCGKERGWVAGKDEVRSMIEGVGNGIKKPKPKVPTGSVAPFIASSIEAARAMLRIARVGPKDIVYDLGSGDGRILITAVQEFKARKAVGVELREDLVEKSRKEISKLGLNGRVEIIHDDLFNVSVQPADVVTLYLTGKGNERLRSKLKEELKAGARVVSRGFKIRGWKPLEVKRIGLSSIYLYKFGQ